MTTKIAQQLQQDKDSRADYPNHHYFCIMVAPSQQRLNLHHHYPDNGLTTKATRKTKTSPLPGPRVTTTLTAISPVSQMPDPHHLPTPLAFTKMTHNTNPRCPQHPPPHTTSCPTPTSTYNTIMTKRVQQLTKTAVGLDPGRSFALGMTNSAEVGHLVVV